MTPDALTARDVPLRDGHHVLVRHVRHGDDAELMALYEALDPDDRYRRFFGSHHPRPDFYSDMATVAERGGARLVAVLTGAPPAAERIIGEAGYVLLPNGDGELGMTVGKRWRGWLGPYLLDALVETAALAGVPNLEADVLAMNGPMLALLRSRGSVVMDHDGWSVARLIIGTARRIPTWPGLHDRPRVLVEGAGGRWHAEDEAGFAGLQLLTCPGPLDGRPRCPALDGEPCPLAKQADVIVVSHPPEDAKWRELLAEHAKVHPGVPVCLEPSGDRVDDDLKDLDVVVCPVAEAAEVVGFVGRLAGPRGSESDPIVESTHDSPSSADSAEGEQGAGNGVEGDGDEDAGEPSLQCGRLVTASEAAAGDDAGDAREGEGTDDAPVDDAVVETGTDGDE